MIMFFARKNAGPAVKLTDTKGYIGFRVTHGSGAEINHAFVDMRRNGNRVIVNSPPICAQIQHLTDPNIEASMKKVGEILGRFADHANENGLTVAHRQAFGIKDEPILRSLGYEDSGEAYGLQKTMKPTRESLGKEEQLILEALKKRLAALNA